MSLTQETRNVFHLYFHFLLFGETEECFTLFDDVLNKCIIDACIFDIEEAHIKECVAQRAQESWFGG